jgi:hypothetical protein
VTTLPTRRTSLRGETFEGERLLLSLAVATKLYRCPSCREPLGIGTEHVFVRYLDADAPWDHEHWHGRCVSERLMRSLAAVEQVPAAKRPRPQRRRPGRR